MSSRDVTSENSAWHRLFVRRQKKTRHLTFVVTHVAEINIIARRRFLVRVTAALDGSGVLYCKLTDAGSQPLIMHRHSSVCATRQRDLPATESCTQQWRDQGEHVTLWDATWRSIKHICGENYGKLKCRNQSHVQCI